MTVGNDQPGFMIHPLVAEALRRLVGGGDETETLIAETLGETDTPGFAEALRTALSGDAAEDIWRASNP